MKQIFTILCASSILGTALTASGQTYYNMSDSNFFEDFSSINTWTNNYANAPYWEVASGTNVFTTGTSGGVQKGTEKMVFLATGTNIVRTDLLLNFTNRNAGTVSLDWAKENNGTTTRYSALSLQYSTDGVNFFPLGTDTALVLNNSVSQSGSFNIALPTS